MRRWTADEWADQAAEFLPVFVGISAGFTLAHFLPSWWVVVGAFLPIAVCVLMAAAKRGET